mgnify:CR=1 FL=1
MPSAFTASYGLTTLPQVRLMLDAAQLPAAQWAPVMHARMHDSPLQAGDSEPLYALTEGNPFFVEEVLKSLVAAGECAEFWF